MEGKKGRKEGKKRKKGKKGKKEIGREKKMFPGTNPS